MDVSRWANSRGLTALLVTGAFAAGAYGVHSVLEQTEPEPRRPVTQWRWESYRTVQLRVPGDWGSTCVVKREPAYVGRLGAVPDIGCGSRLSDPEVRSPYLWFASREPVGVQGSGDGWTAETRLLLGVKVTVFTDDDVLRDSIFGSAQPIVSTDAYGCQPNVPTKKPPLGHALAAVGAVQSVTICDYRGRQLFASSRLEGARAQAAVDAVLAAPAGRGPDSKEKCTKVSPIGLQLKVDGTAQAAEVAIHYSGCAGNGASDGTIERRLTRPYLQLLLSGPHRLSGWSGDSGIGLLPR
ncbi:hypothetical protein [Kribbella sp. CA-293567]|uniref:hypothetical protein n=1 Tax=Kribbella sp. CA-293567 TaxID=3002436 RepID=UPI0022DD0C64|nr:hypothetical protein [Kribbella sp. CA-293567]WBQ04533.1 hypothetical protein OX958_31785 [Kribbella sp. CA-293567]